MCVVRRDRGLAIALSVVDVLRRPLVELLERDRAPERLAFAAHRCVTRAQAVLAVVLLAVVWGTCVVQPGLFVLAILPMGWAAYVATSLVFRLAATGVPARASGRPLLGGSARLHVAAGGGPCVNGVPGALVHLRARGVRGLHDLRWAPVLGRSARGRARGPGGARRRRSRRSATWESSTGRRFSWPPRR